MSPAGPLTILIAYDGSDPARHAVEEAGRLFPGASARVLTVWRSAHRASGAARVALPDDVISQAVQNLDKGTEAGAADTADDGAALAREAGLDASPATERTDDSLWASILRYADEHDAAAIVVGSRGQSAVRSALLGSVSNGVVHNSRRPVVVVHPPDDDAS
jgi:nucleotide-binding universal stress UspA family protein